MLTFAGAIALAALLLAAEFRFSDRIFLKAFGGRQVSEDEYPVLHTLVERLASSIGIPKPRILVVDSEVPNAFATGCSPSRSAIGVHSALLSTVNLPELEGVLAHEVTHIKNGDVAVMSLALLFPAAADLCMSMLRWFLPLFLLLYPVYLLIRGMGHVLIMPLSRYRELLADRGAVIITGEPTQLSSALLKMATAVEKASPRRSINPFFTIPMRFSKLLSTHPSLETRLRRLHQMREGIDMYGAWHLFSSDNTEFVIETTKSPVTENLSGSPVPITAPASVAVGAYVQETSMPEPLEHFTDATPVGRWPETLLGTLGVVTVESKQNGVGKVTLDGGLGVFPAKGETGFALAFGALIQVATIKPDYLEVRRVI